MNDADRIQALLNLVDPERTADVDQSERLVVFGLAARRRRMIWPTAAGWNLLGDVGRTFNPER